MTLRKLEYWSVPARFCAKQVYFPEWAAWTDSIVRWLVLLFVFPVSIPSNALMCWPFKVQVIFIGISPLEIAHVTVTKSPELTTSSPKENGWIWGGTGRNVIM